MATFARISPFWILLELRMMEVVVTTGSVRRAVLHYCHHQQTSFFTGRMPFLSLNRVRALKGDIANITEKN